MSMTAQPLACAAWNNMAHVMPQNSCLHAHIKVRLFLSAQIMLPSICAVLDLGES